MQSRYYNPEVGRFINVDDISYLGADGTLTSYNLYAYCGNNPVMGYDPTGYWNWRTFWDGVVTASAAVVSVVVSITTVATSLSKGSSPIKAIAKGVVAGTLAFGAINNLANAIYYNHISKGTSTLETKYADLQPPNQKSDYVDGYINRWDRLDYTKQQTQDSTYCSNTMRFMGEYSMHMYGWLAGSALNLLDHQTYGPYFHSAQHAHLYPHLAEERLKPRLLGYFFGLLGV